MRTALLVCVHVRVISFRPPPLPPLKKVNGIYFLKLKAVLNSGNPGANGHGV